MNACHHTRALLERAFDGSLGLEERFRVEEHNAGCARCRAAWEQHDALLDALAAQPAPPLERLDGDAFAASVRAAIDATLDAAGEVRRPRRAAPWIAAAAAAAAVIVFFVLSRGETPRALLEPVAEVPGESPSPVAPLVSSNFAPTDFDAARHTAALESVRAALLDASAGEELHGEVTWIAGFDALTAQLARDWPVDGLVRRLLADDDDPRVAGAAARLLGQRGGRLAAAALERALERPDRARAALLALFDAGPSGERALARAWWRPELRAALRARVELEDDVVAYVERALAEGPRRATEEVREQAGGLLELLADAGEPGARALLALGVDERFERARLLDCLERSPAAPGVLVDVLSDRRAAPEPYLLDVAERLHPAGALEWVVARARSGGQRARAARALAAFPGVRALAQLVELEGAGGLRGDDFLAAWDVAVARDDDSLRALAWRRLDAGHRTAARDYLELLLLTERPEAIPAALILAGPDLLSDDLRRAALLAAGERGTRAHVEPLAWAFDQLGPDELGLAAACALSAWRLGGADALAELLRVDHAALAPLTTCLAAAPATGPARATLYRLAHELEPVFDSRHPDPRGTNQ